MRPPLMTKGQADDFYGYMTIGTGLMWLVGGVAAGPAAIAIAACAAGTVANRMGVNGNNPQMRWRPPQGPPGPLEGLPPDVAKYVHGREGDLRREFGENAVYCYRQMVFERWQPEAAYNFFVATVRPLKEQGYWVDGRLQGNPGESAQQLLMRISGRGTIMRRSSVFTHQWFQQFWGGISRNLTRNNAPQTIWDKMMIDTSMLIYVLGVEPICDKPVTRIKVWLNYDNKASWPVYYVSGDRWYFYDNLETEADGGLPGRTAEARAINAQRNRLGWRGRFDAFLEMETKSGMLGPDELDECEALWQYRVEPHHSEGPPGHPDPSVVSWKNVLFGRNQGSPASAEDMRGLP